MNLYRGSIFFLFFIGFLFERTTVYSRNEVFVTELKAHARFGQVFLTWNESHVATEVTFQVFMSSSPITATTLSKAGLVGFNIEAGSACDWWQDPASYTFGVEPDRSHGFKIDGRELDPRSGLFVYTSRNDESTYFAVLPSSADSSDIVPGGNSLEVPVYAAPELIQPIRLRDGPLKNCAIGKSLTLALHGRGGGSNLKNEANFLVFGDSLQGWREGLARKFIVQEDAGGIVIKPLDRIWVGRPLLFSSDPRDHVPAINTWWYGCNQWIYDADRVADGKVVNYTEEHLLYLVRWAQQYFGTNPDKTYITGKSMGGSGAISVAFHHPDQFAAVYSDVPIVAYTTRKGRDGRSNHHRLDGLCGRICDETVMSVEGLSVLERMNQERIVMESDEELPFLVLCNGRTDGSIPWINNPSFYRALNHRKRGFVCYWNNGGHAMGFSVPEDISSFYSLQPEITLSNSFPAFSNFSDNCNPGNGEKDDGDTIGWMNRGICWSDIEETEDRWCIRLQTKGYFLPDQVSVDVTPRRLTRFRIAPNEIVLVNGQPVTADQDGLLTIHQVHLELGKIVQLEVRRRF